MFEALNRWQNDNLVRPSQKSRFGGEKFYPLTFFLSLVHISVFTYYMVKWACFLAMFFHVPVRILGLGVEQAKTTPSIRLQEKFHRGSLKGCQKYFWHPFKQRYKIPPGQGKMPYSSPPDSPCSPPGPRCPTQVSQIGVKLAS